MVTASITRNRCKKHKSNHIKKDSDSIRIGVFFYLLPRVLIIVIMAGKRRTTNIEGKMKRTIGKMILTGALRACALMNCR